MMLWIAGYVAMVGITAVVVSLTAETDHDEELNKSLSYMISWVWPLIWIFVAILGTIGAVIVINERVIRYVRKRREETR